MATGPHDNRYQIPDITLGDTFNEWRTTTNDGIIDKLNRMKIYTGISGDGISLDARSDGTLVVEHSGVVQKGVTFSGPVTFNGAYTVVNAQEFSVDDYIIMLGATGAGSSGLSAGGPGAADSVINSVGGGGIQILRADGFTAQFLWRTTKAGGSGSDGVTGMWWLEGPNVGLTNEAVVYPQDKFLRVQTNAGGSSAEMFIIGTGTGLTMDGSGKSADMSLKIQASAGSIHDLAYIREVGGSAGYINFINGVNRRRVSMSNHGFSFGMAVRYEPAGAGDFAGGFTLAKADSADNAEAVGIVGGLQGSNTADIVFSGEVIGDFRDAVGGETLTPGKAYFLSTTASGKLTTAQPTDSGLVNKPMFVALDNIPTLGVSGDRALVVNYRGSLVPDETDDLSLQTANRYLVNQINDFVVGDAVRFDGDRQYGFTQGATASGGTYSNGVYLRAQANSAEEAEIVGLVTKVNIGGDPNKFYVSTSGKVSLADNPAITPLDTGNVYFLSPSSAPDGIGGGGFSAESLQKVPPQTDGFVTKAIGVAVSTTEFVITNMKGEVNGVAGQAAGGGGGTQTSELGLTLDSPPVGSVIAWSATGDLPTGYLECNGSLYAKTDYEELYSVIGTLYGGLTDVNFNVPDIRNRTIVGASTTNNDMVFNTTEFTTAPTFQEGTGRRATPENPIYYTFKSSIAVGELGGAQGVRLGTQNLLKTYFDYSKRYAGRFHYHSMFSDREGTPATVQTANAFSSHADMSHMLLSKSSNGNAGLDGTVRTYSIEAADRRDANHTEAFAPRVFAADVTGFKDGFGWYTAPGGAFGSLNADGFADGTHPDVWGTVNDAPRQSPGTQSGFVGRTPRLTYQHGSLYSKIEFDSEGRPHNQEDPDSVLVASGSAGDQYQVSPPRYEDQLGNYAIDLTQPYVGMRYMIKARPDARIVEIESGGSQGLSKVSGRNLLVNGNFDIWQRLGGTSVAGASANAFTSNSSDLGGPYTNHQTTPDLSNRFLADRWGLVNYSFTDAGITTNAWNGAADRGGVARIEFDMSNTTRTGNGALPHATSQKAKYFLRLICNKSGLVAPSIEQRIEGVDSLMGEKATVSFFAKRNAGDNADLRGVALQLDGFASGTGDYFHDADGANNSGGVARNFKMYPTQKSQPFELSSTWKKYTFTFNVPNFLGASAGINASESAPPTNWSGPGLGAIPEQGFVALRFVPLNGNAVESIDTTHSGDFTKIGMTGDALWNGEFDIAQVQIERGGQESKFEVVPKDEQLKRCERYYQKSYASFDAPATDTQHGLIRVEDDTVGDGLQLFHNLPVEMRHSPRVRLYSKVGTIDKVNGPVPPDGTATVTTGTYNDYPDAGPIRILNTTDNVNESGFVTAVQTAEATDFLGALGSGKFAYHYVADAEI